MVKNALLLKDGYKVGHIDQYPCNTEMVYSNWTARGSRIKGIDEVVFFGLQYFMKEYLIKTFNEDFFDLTETEAVTSYMDTINAYLGPDAVAPKHIRGLHSLGYLPVEIRALPEGTLVPLRVLMFTIHNTHKDFAWVTNMLETLISCTLWLPCTTATLAHRNRMLLDDYAEATGASKDFVPFQAHDFSMRGMGGLEAAKMSGAAHLLSGVGTDCIPAINFLEHYYNASRTKEMIGVSVAATEHSVMCMGGEADEEGTFRRLLDDVYPIGIVSVVSDTWDFWKTVTVTLPKLKDLVMARDGKLVIRPDSGDPVKIITGDIEIWDVHDSSDVSEEAENILNDDLVEQTPHGERGADNITGYFRHLGNIYKCIYTPEWNRFDKQYYFIDGGSVEVEEYTLTPENKGLIECLWETFGGTTNDKGFKELDSHIGAIYGDSITYDRMQSILVKLAVSGFASSNIVFGVGSYTYQYNTRDTFGFAIKSTAGIIDGKEVAIFKDPKTDNGLKKSARGFLIVQKGELIDGLPLSRIEDGDLELVFRDGVLIRDESLTSIRKRLEYARSK